MSAAVRAFLAGFSASWRSSDTDVTTARSRLARSRVLLNRWKKDHQ